MKQNRCTLIVDSGWLNMNNFHVMTSLFDENLPDNCLEEARDLLVESMAGSIVKIINQHPIIDNIIVVSDYGSWRKKLKLPLMMQGESYKGQRQAQKEQYHINWNYVFEAVGKLMKNTTDNNITSCRYMECEGDDWIWYWTQYLFNNNISAIIWSSDKDLQQLINYSPSEGTFIGWYNNKELVLHEKIQTLKSFNNIDNMMTIFNFNDVDQIKINLLNSLNTFKSKKFINPQDIIISKILYGDNSDNIKPLINFKKNDLTRAVKLTPKNFDGVVNNLFHENINEVDTLDKNIDSIIKELLKLKRYKNIKFETVYEMYLYNKKLVTLSDKYIPQELITEMKKYEYKICDIKSIKNNPSLLTRGNKESNMVEKIFEDIKF